MEGRGTLGHIPPDAPDEIQFGRPRRPRGARRPRRRRGPWLPGLLVTAAIAAAIVFGVAHHARPHRMPRSSAHVTLIGRPILGVHAGWQLFARSEDALVVISLAKGKVTRTEVPGLQSGNPAVSFVIGPHEAVIRSYDYVPGYLIPDGGHARQLTGALAGGGPLIQGPVPGEAWQFASTSSDAPLVLMTLAGHRVGPAIRLRKGALAVTVTSDGRGYVLVLTDAGQWYDAGPGWYRRVAGQVIAIGPGEWLILACPHGHCRNELADTAGGTLRTLSGPPLRAAVHFWPPAGAISPDGSAAAIIETGRTSTVHLINLSSGADTRLALPATDQPADGSMAWSPDGRWLFVALNGDLFAVDARNDRVTGLGISLPTVRQVAVRPAPG